MPQKGLVSCIIIAMTANIVYNWLFSEGLFQLGQNIIFDMQQHSNDYLDYFFELFTLIVDPVIVVVAAVTLIITVRKKRIGFNALIFIILNCYLTTVLKAIYADPRPFWDHPSIYNLGYYCPK